MNLTLCLIVLWLLPTGLSSDYYSNPLGKQSTAPAAQSIAGSWAIRSSTPGLVWTSRKYVDSSYGNQVVNVLDIDLTLVKLRSVRTQYSNKYESILSMGNRTKALAGVNGGFFCYTTDDICSTTACSSPTNCPPPVQPRSLLIISGTTKSANCALRTSFGLTGTGVPKIQQVGAGQSWPGVSYAVGAGPNLVTGGTKNITQEGFCWYTESAPRTAVATTSNGHILLVTVDGRYKGADGMTIDMLADFLINEFKVTSAMNLDGGGSTSMYYGGKIVNSPSDKTCDGCCRCVYDGLFVYAQ
jgi:hypothetical protein